jgi:hypothetical protein
MLPKYLHLKLRFNRQWELENSEGQGASMNHTGNETALLAAMVRTRVVT